MEIRQYARLLRKWLWLVVACTLLAAVTAYGVSRNSTPVYQSTATLLVNQASNPAIAAGYQDILTSERLARTYANMLSGWPVIEETAKRLGVSSKGLEKTITVTPVRDTQLLEVRVEGTDPNLIAQIANTLPEVFIAQNQEIRSGRVGEAKASLQKEILAVEADIARTQASLAGVTDDLQRLRLEASLAQFRTTYSALLASYQQVRLSEANATDNLVIAKPARVPLVPIRPRTSTNTLLAAVVGAMIALGAAFLVEYLDDTVKTPDDVLRVANLVTLGAIARLKEGSGQRQLVAWLQSKAPESEAYRTLRTNIQFSSVDKPVRTLLVTSAGPSEGKSTTAANLAVVMAQTGQRVLLVDTDLRRPVMHKVFETPNNVGLTTALLAGGAGIEGHIQPTQIENLSLLSSGPIPPNPSELLGSHKMAALVGKLAELADLVIFDSPPVLAVTDAAVLGRQVDGAVLVVDSGQTREQALGQAAAELRKTGTNLLGVALNRLDSRSGGYYYYYYYYTDEGGNRRRRSGERGSNGEQSPAGFRWPWQRKGK